MCTGNSWTYAAYSTTDCSNTAAAIASGTSGSATCVQFTTSGGTPIALYMKANCVASITPVTTFTGSGTYAGDVSSKQPIHNKTNCQNNTK